MKYGIQLDCCFLYFHESILKAEYFVADFGFWLKTWDPEALCSATNSIFDFRENWSVFVSHLCNRNNIHVLSSQILVKVYTQRILK